VAKPGQKVDLSVEPGLVVPIVEGEPPDNFDGHVLARSKLNGLVDDSLTASADLMDDLVSRERKLNGAVGRSGVEVRPARARRRRVPRRFDSTQCREAFGQLGHELAVCSDDGLVRKRFACGSTPCHVEYDATQPSATITVRAA
jgi:hypothetical protein